MPLAPATSRHALERPLDAEVSHFLEGVADV
jgi:hypothetical protein